jgi:hypothetical protein
MTSNLCLSLTPATYRARLFVAIKALQKAELMLDRKGIQGHTSPDNETE